MRTMFKHLSLASVGPSIVKTTFKTNHIHSYWLHWPSHFSWVFLCLPIRRSKYTCLYNWDFVCFSSKKNAICLQCSFRKIANNWNINILPPPHIYISGSSSPGRCMRHKRWRIFGLHLWVLNITCFTPKLVVGEGFRVELPQCETNCRKRWQVLITPETSPSPLESLPYSRRHLEFLEEVPFNIGPSDECETNQNFSTIHYTFALANQAIQAMLRATLTNIFKVGWHIFE